MTVFHEVNKIFTRCILEKYGSLKVLPVCMEGIDFDNYPQDQKLLYENHRKLESCETPSIPAQVLPFTQTNYKQRKSTNYSAGSGGNRNEQKIFIGNAYPAGYKELNKELNEELSILKKCRKYKNDLSV